MEEIELKDSIEKAEDKINKCLKLNDDCIVKKFKNKKENLEMNGLELGLYEVDQNKNNVASVSLINIKFNIKIVNLKWDSVSVRSLIILF